MTVDASTPEPIALLVAGAGPAGLSAAQAFRDHGGTGRVVILSADPDAPYNRPPLSKDFLRGESPEADLPLANPEELRRLGIEVITDAAVSLDPSSRTMRTASGAEFTYGSCVLATGSQPARLPVPGGDDPRLLTLRTLADSKRLRAAAGSAQTAIVVGSGFIGCEAAASLSRLGLRVTQVSGEPAPQHARLGPAVAARIARWLQDDEGVRLVGSRSVTAFAPAGQGWSVRLDDDDDSAISGDAPAELAADLVLVAVGVTPSGAVAADAGLAMDGPRVLVDEQMRTSAAGVMAAGDVARAHNLAAGRSLSVEHWGEAQRMGEIAGATAASEKASEKASDNAADEPADGWANVPGFWSQIGDHTLKYAAWGDGYDRVRLRDYGNGAFTAWYLDEKGSAVGVITHEADQDYDDGQDLVRLGKPVPSL